MRRLLIFSATVVAALLTAIAVAPLRGQTIPQAARFGLTVGIPVGLILLVLHHRQKRRPPNGAG